jgi:Cu/Ag efflux protein CusF
MTCITRLPSPAAALRITALAFAVSSASAQHAGHAAGDAGHGAPEAGPTTAAAAAGAGGTATTPFTHGEVRHVDLRARKLTLRHGVIQNLEMPPMTMVFQVADPAILDQLAVGDTVRFRAERRQGAIVVTALERDRP